MRDGSVRGGSGGDVFLRTMGLGAISGLRSTSGPAFLSRAAAQGRIGGLENTRFASLGSPRVAARLRAALLGELIIDKLPTTPSRTMLGALAGRVLSGALTGAALFASSGRRAAAGGAIGAAAAVVAAPIGERLREIIVSRTGFPDPAVALLEDAIVLYLGARLPRGVDHSRLG